MVTLFTSGCTVGWLIGGVVGCIVLFRFILDACCAFCGLIAGSGFSTSTSVFVNLWVEDFGSFFLLKRLLMVWLMFLGIED